jgi:hypothetical protein
MSAGVGPPQVSPDGKWVWDGQRWLPLPPAGAEVSVPATSIPYAQPDTDPSVATFVYAPPMASTPAWPQPASTRPSVFKYAAAGAVALVLLLVVLNATGMIQIPWPGTASPTVTMIHGSPPPLIPDYDQANRFLNLSLAPALDSLGNTLPAVSAACKATLSSGCHSAVNATNTQMTNVLSVIDHGSIPDCIAVGMKTMRNDLQDMAGGIGVALHGFQDNSADEVDTGIYHFAVVGQSLKTDLATLDSEVPACPRVIPS